MKQLLMPWPICAAIRISAYLRFDPCMRLSFNSYLLFFVIAAGALFVSCKLEDEITTDPKAILRFSTDTLFFDTVFSDLGGGPPLSVTKQLWVINENDKTVKVNIRLQGTSNGSVRMNIDGLPSSAITGKEIGANDSIVIFVQFYSNAGNDFIITEQLLFETNGNLQDVDIVGFGRDAYYYRNQVLPGAGGQLIWQNDKPHVIYDSILIPAGTTLTIKAGARIHSHVKSVILVQGTLLVEGEYGSPVIFEGDRLDAEYRNRAGQWIGIRFLPGSKDNVIRHAIIKNGVLGIEVDSLPVNSNPNLLLRESFIDNMSAVGIVGYTANLVAINNVVTNCGQFTFYGVLGGEYTLYHNTFASFNFTLNRQTPHFVLDNSPFKDESGNIVAKYPLNYRVVNTIIYGSREEEVVLNNAADGEQSFTTRIFQTNLLRTKTESLNVNGNILNQDPRFENAGEVDMRLKSDSPAKGKGTALGVLTDIGKQQRSATAPGIGAWE